MATFDGLFLIPHDYLKNLEISDSEYQSLKVFEIYKSKSHLPPFITHLVHSSFTIFITVNVNKDTQNKNVRDNNVIYKPVDMRCIIIKQINIDAHESCDIPRKKGHEKSMKFSVQQS